MPVDPLSGRPSTGSLSSFAPPDSAAGTFTGARADGRVLLRMLDRLATGGVLTARISRSS